MQWLDIEKGVVPWLVVLGYILGKWHDEGVSFKRFLKNIISSFRDNKWQ